MKSALPSTLLKSIAVASGNTCSTQYNSTRPNIRLAYKSWESNEKDGGLCQTQRINRLSFKRSTRSVDSLMKQGSSRKRNNLFRSKSSRKSRYKLSDRK